jgi:hypothetical protein
LALPGYKEDFTFSEGPVNFFDLIKLHGFLFLEQFDVQVLSNSICFLIEFRCTEIWFKCLRDLSMIEMILWSSETAFTDAIFDDTLLLPLVDPFSVIRYLSFEIYIFSTKRIYKVFEFQILSFNFI